MRFTQGAGESCGVALMVFDQQERQFPKAAFQLLPFFLGQRLVSERLQERSCRRDEYLDIRSDRHIFASGERDPHS